VVKEARYHDKAWNLQPGVQGGHGWHANAYSPDTGLLYIATQDAYFPMVGDPGYKRTDVGYNLGLDFTAPTTYYQKNPVEKSGFVGYLQAWDPVSGKQVWRSDENQGPTGGALATAGGLVFQGSGAGSELRVFDQKTGEKLWSFPAQTAVLAPPISYELGGRQYVAVSVGGAVPGGYYAPNYSRLLVFAVGGKAKLPPTTPYVAPELNPPADSAPADVVAAGAQHYGKFCAACHGDNGQTRGSTFPNLMVSALLYSQAGFDQVVLKGVRAGKGMVSFATVLDGKATEALRAYIIARANEAKKLMPPPASAPVQQHQ
jgi:alcohol dehydrogenase (cytochrome c)/quinohemoprotein ethanol dehydrogenase